MSSDGFTPLESWVLIGAAFCSLFAIVLAGQAITSEIVHWANERRASLAMTKWLGK